MTIQQHLAFFLKNKNVYEKFIYNTKGKLKKDSKPSSLLFNSLHNVFTMDRNEFIFWSKLNEEWKLYLYRNNHTFMLYDMFLKERSAIEAYNISNLFHMFDVNIETATLENKPYDLFLKGFKWNNLFVYKRLKKAHNEWYEFLKRNKEDVPNNFVNSLNILKKRMILLFCD